MTEIPINLADSADAGRVIDRVERVLASHGLVMTLRGSVRQYPGCTHWHWKNARQPGTLEVTFWPAERRLWFKVQAGRGAVWIDQLVPVLKAELENG